MNCRPSSEMSGFLGVGSVDVRGAFDPVNASEATTGF